MTSRVLHGGAFGLEFDAPFSLPELASTTGGKRIKVELRAADAVCQGWTGEPPHRVYGHPDGVAIAADGTTIRVACTDSAPPELVRLLTLGAGVCMVLVAHGCGVLHATTVRIAGRDVAICGPSGVGKSSFTAALLKRGGVLVADDLCVLDPEGPLSARVGLPRVKLWDDTAQHFGHDPSQLARVHPGFDKRSVPIQLVTERAPLTDVIVLQRGPADHGQITGGEAITTLLANHRLPEVLTPDQQADWLRLASRLAGEVPIERITLPGDLDALEQAADAWLQRG